MKRFYNLDPAGLLVAKKRRRIAITVFIPLCLVVMILVSMTLSLLTAHTAKSATAPAESGVLMSRLCRPGISRPLQAT